MVIRVTFFAGGVLSWCATAQSLFNEQRGQFAEAYGSQEELGFKKQLNV